MRYLLRQYLVGGIPTPLKNIKVSWDYYSQYMEIHKAMFQTTSQIWVCLKMGNWTHGEKSD